MICYITTVEDKQYLCIMDAGKFYRFEANDENMRRLNAECAVRLLQNEHANIKEVKKE